MHIAEVIGPEMASGDLPISAIAFSIKICSKRKIRSDMMIIDAKRKII